MLDRCTTILIAVVACALPGCGAPPEPSDAAKRIRPEYDRATGKLRRLEYDKNGDGKPDTWADMDGARIVKVEVDDNGDGQVDRWEYYAGPGAGEPGGAGKAGETGQSALPQVERIERATKRDGTVSRWEFFENGALARVEEDTTGDGKVDKWETYSNGSLSVLALDTKGRGRPDRRLMYRPNGSLDHIETDPAGSGSFAPVKP